MDFPKNILLKNVITNSKNALQDGLSNIASV